MPISVKSYQQILGQMLRKMYSVTGLSDTTKGSVMLTLLEAAAQSDFEQFGTMIQLLDNFSLDNTTGSDLDKRAVEHGLTEGRLSATFASGLVTITDSTITKISSNVYAGDNPPIIGDAVVKINDGSDFPATGSIYVGRDSDNEEGPIAYSSITDNVTHWEITLSSTLSNNHNVDENVVLSQSGTRTIGKGTQVKVPTTNLSEEVLFTTQKEATIEDGEDTVNNVLVRASSPGSDGNVPAGSITEFGSTPFTGAAVTNLTSFSNARDLESDEELRDRIKNHIQSLSKGVGSAILNGVIGVNDSQENKTVNSASLVEPTTAGGLAKLYIDDGTGFEPSFAGKGSEDIITEAAGTERFLQLGNFPLVKAQAISNNTQPYDLTAGGDLQVKVNGIQETINLSASDFDIPSSALATEVAESINNTALTIRARTTEGQTKVVIFAREDEDEKIQVVGGSVNDELAFSTDEIFTLKLYKNDVLLSKDGETAILESDDFDNWNSISSPATFNITVNSKPTQFLRITNSTLEVSADGSTYNDVTTGRTTLSDLGVTLNTATVSNWATVLDQIISGATVSQNGDVIRITSDLENSSSSSLATSGTLATEQGWPTTTSTGKASEYTLNRFSGQIELEDALVSGDTITAGSENTRGSVSSTSTSSSYDLTTDADGRVAALHIVLDSEESNTVTKRETNIVGGTTTITVSNPSGDTFRYTASSVAFSDYEVGDYVVVIDEPGNSVNEGTFQITAVDASGTWFEVTNPSGATAGPTTIKESTDVQAFKASVPPQKVTFTSGTTTPANVVTQITDQTVGLTATVETDSSGDSFVKMITNKYAVGGSITVPVSSGNAINLGFSTVTALSVEAHTSALQSESEVGGLVLGSRGTLTGDDTSDPFTTIADTSREFDTDNTTPNEWVKFLTGTNRLLKGFIESIDTANSITLKDNTYTATGVKRVESHNFLNSQTTGTEYQHFYPFDLNSNDNIVVVVDGDEIAKTHNISMARSGRVSATSSDTELDAIDTDATASGVSFSDSLWSGYDFSDYKIWFKAHRVNDVANDKNAVIWRSAKYGPTGEKIRVRYDYPIEEGLSPEASISNDDKYTLVTIKPGSSGTLKGSHDATTEFDTSTGDKALTITHSGTGTAPAFTSGTAVVPGDIATINVTGYSENGTYLVTAVTATSLTLSDRDDVVTSGGGGTFTLGSLDGLKVYSLSSNTGEDLRGAANNDSTVSDILEGVLTDEDPNGTTNDGSGTIDNATGDDFLFGIDNTTEITVTTLANDLAKFEITAGSGDFSTLRPGDEFVSRSATGGNAMDSSNRGTFTVFSASATEVVVKNANATGETVAAGSFSADDVDFWGLSKALVDGQNYIKVFDTSTPFFTLKQPLIERSVTGGGGSIYDFHTAPNLDSNDTGELFKLIPTTARNLEDHFNKTAITALSLNADIVRSEDGEKIQISSKTTGTSGSVHITGGSGNNVTISATRNGITDGDAVRVGFSSSAVTGFHVGQQVKVTNTTGARKLDTFDSNTSVDVNSPGQTFTLSDRPSFGFTTSTSQITITAGTGNKWIWTLSTGPGDLSTAKVGDELHVPSGSPFASGNEGSFPITDVTSTAITVINPNGTAEGPITIAAATDMVAKTPFFLEPPVTLGGVFKVEKLSDELVQYRHTSGTAPEFVDNGVERDYTVEISSDFSTENTGIFRVLYVENDRFVVENSNAIEEEVTTTSSSMFFRSVDSAVVGDVLNVASIISSSWFVDSNQGTHTISAVGRNGTGNHVATVGTTGLTTETVTLGVNSSSFFVTEGDTYESIREVTNISVDPVSPSTALIWLSPGSDSNRFLTSLGTQITSINKVGFSTTEKTGNDGYQYWTGLLRKVHRTVDGFDADPITFPGIKATGSQVEVLPPQLERIAISVDVTPVQGLQLSVIRDQIRSAILSYISGLGVGEDVITSRISKAVQDVPGVKSVLVTSPENVEVIAIQDNEKAIAFSDDITVT